MFEDYYEILGVDTQVDGEALRKAFRQKSWEFHPDRGGSSDQMKRINEAWTILSNQDLREVYDRTRKGKNSTEKALADEERRDREEAEKELWRYLKYHNQMNPGVAKFYADPKRAKAKKIQKHLVSFWGMLKIVSVIYVITFFFIALLYYLFVDPLF